MIEGRLSDEGAVATGVVYLPSIGRFLEVDFVIDIGAAVTCLMPNDIEKLTPSDTERLSASLIIGRTSLRGVSGVFPHGVAPASLKSEHSDGSSSIFALFIRVATNPSVTGGPSLLGRDVLFRGQLSAGRDGVSLDIAPGDHDLLRPVT